MTLLMPASVNLPKVFLNKKYEVNLLASYYSYIKKAKQYFANFQYIAKKSEGKPNATKLLLILEKITTNSFSLFLTICIACLAISWQTRLRLFNKNVFVLPDLFFIFEMNNHKVSVRHHKLQPSSIRSRVNYRIRKIVAFTKFNFAANNTQMQIM